MMELIVSWLCSAIAEGFEEAAKIFGKAFGYSPNNFRTTFEFAGDAYIVIQDAALGLALFLTGWQIFTFFFRGIEKSQTTPARIAINAIVSVGFIFYGNYLFDLILVFCQYPFDAIQSGSMGDVVDWGVRISGAGDALFLFMQDVLAPGMGLVYLLLILLIVFNWIKLMLEIVERYVVAFVLVYLSPLASASLASSTTSGIYKKFFTMFISQCILIFLNMWSMKMVCDGFDMSGGDPEQAMIIRFLLVYGFLRIACKMDSYINQLGLNAAVTGAGIGAELLAAGGMMMHAGKGGGGSSGSGGGSILGAAKSMQSFVNRTHPVAAAGKSLVDGIKGGVSGASEAFRSGGGIKGAVKGLGQGFGEGFQNSNNLISNATRGKSQKSRLQDNAPSSKDSAPADKNSPAPADVDKPADTAPTDINNPDTQSSDPAGTITASGAAEMSNDDEADHAGSAEANTSAKTDNQKQKAKEDQAEKEQYERDLKAWSNNPHLAHSGYEYIRQENGVVNDHNKVAAVAKGLGVANYSPEGAEFVKVGFGQGDGIAHEKFKLDANGIHAEYDSQDGYRHKMEIRDSKQFAKMNIAEREGFEKLSAPDGHRYYIKTYKTKIEPIPKDSVSPSEDSRNDKKKKNPK